MEENKGKTNTMMIGVVVVVLAVVGAVLFFRNQASSTPDQANTPTLTQSIELSQSPSSRVEENSVFPTNQDIKVVNLEAGSFYFKPNVITFKKGQKIKIVMKSVDMMHDFVIDELNVKLPVVKSGNTDEVEFVADKVGTFEYYCSVGQHRSNGQVGKLIVQ